MNNTLLAALYRASCVLLFFSFFFASCTHRPYDLSVKQMPSTECIGLAPTFDKDIQPIFLASCAKTGCHDAVSMPHNFSIYSEIKPRLDDSTIYYFVIKDHKMPQDGPLPDTAFKLVKCWFANNCPEK